MSGTARAALCGGLLMMSMHALAQGTSAPATPASPPAASASAPASLSPEVQLCLMHLRDGERERLQAAVGPLDELPLYRLQLEVDAAERRITGRAQIQQVAKTRALDAMYLRVTPNALGKRVRVYNATLNGQPAVLEQPEPTLYRVRLDPPVEPGAAAVVEVLLDATVPQAPKEASTLLGGMQQTNGPRDYGAFSASPDALILTGILPQIPPTDERGEPWEGPSGLGDLALYEPSHVLTSVTVPHGYTVLTSGAALGEVPEKDGRVRFSYAASAVRDFPLVIARGYQKQEATVDGVVVESWYAPTEAEAGGRALEYTRASLTELQKRLGPLPYKVFRVVEAPLTGGAGGMEFSGLIIVSTGLYRTAMDPASAMGLPPSFAAIMGQNPELDRMMEETLEFTVAHEVAHQYFAGLVGSDPVREPVVDEALAQHTALLYMEWKRGRAAAERIRKQHLVGGYHMYRMSGGEDGPAARPTSEFNGSMEYAALVYGKAPLFLSAARKLVGDAAYTRGLRAYVEQYRYKWTCAKCFTQTLAKQKPDKAAALEKLRVRWLEEAHGDEDLGKPSMDALMPGMSGMGSQPLDQQMEQLMREMIRQLAGE